MSERTSTTVGSKAFAAVRETVIVVLMALALSFVVKTWLLQAFYIPSGSMENTLVEHDRVVVNKLVPQLMDLRRGDVIVFEDPGDWLAERPPTDRGAVGNAVHQVLTFVGLLPSEAEDHLIKRVIGLPGDHVTCCTDGKVAVNGAPVAEPYVKPGDEPSSMTFSITVPDGKVWVMGDHRSNSEDSRFHDPAGDGVGGSVPLTKITGRAAAVVWPVDHWAVLHDQSAVFASVPAPGAATPGPTATPDP